MKIDRYAFVLILILAVGLLFATAATELGVRPSEKPTALGFVQLPGGFEINTYADGLEGSATSYPGPNAGPRMMLWQDDVLYTSVMKAGEVAALPDRDGDGKADETITFMDGLENPHGLEWRDDWFYIAEETRVIRVQDTDGDLRADEETLEVLIDGLPTGGHFTRTIKIHNGSLFLSVGSSCNLCIEENEWRAAIHRCNLDGSDCRVYAEGLRNAVGFVFHGGDLYATENGRDNLGEDLPPDEVNLVREGGDYGWPHCYGDRVRDTDFGDEAVSCAGTEPSFVDLQAHSAPLGLDFYTGDAFPEEYRGDIFVAYHGSWNREEPTGYKVVRIDTETKRVTDFASGWLAEDETVRGRPVGVLEHGGNLFISDDNAGRVYRVSYTG